MKTKSVKINGMNITLPVPTEREAEALRRNLEEFCQNTSPYWKVHGPVSEAPKVIQKIAELNRINVGRCSWYQRFSVQVPYFLMKDEDIFAEIYNPDGYKALEITAGMVKRVLGVKIVRIQLRPVTPRR